MPKRELMSWEGHPYNRWVKMHKGVRYRVSCEQLNAPLFTREASYKLANEWWKHKQAELDLPSPEQQIRNRWSVEEHLERIRKAQDTIAATEQLLFGLGYRPQVTGTDLFATVIHEDGNTNLDGLGKLVAKVDDKPAVKDRTIGYQMKEFLESEQARGKKYNTYALLTYFLRKVTTCALMDTTKSIDCITEESVEKFYRWVKTDSGHKGNSVRNLWIYFKRFVRYLVEQKLITKPENLESRRFTFDNTAKAVKAYPLAEVKELLSSLPERMRLWAYLGLNCGMLAVDIGSLKHTEVVGNRIIRKRTKTAHHDDVPVVSYILWDETLALLNKFRSNHPELVFVNERGTPLWDCRIGRSGKKNKISVIMFHWRKRKTGIPFKALRSIATNELSQAGYPKEIRLVFRGVAPRDDEEKSYANYSQQKLDEAVMYLRSRLVG